MNSRAPRSFLFVILVILALWWWWQRSRPDTSQPAARPDSAIDVQAVPSAPPPPQRPKPKTDATSGDAPVTESEPDTPGVSPKARQIRGELKLVLSGIYSAEMAFFSEAGRFSTDFDVLGWMPLARELNVRAGFLYPYSPPPDEFRDRGDRYDTDQLVEASQVYDDPQSRMVYTDSARKVTLRTLGSYCEMNCTADAKGFEVIAAANLDDDDDLEIWRINDRKELVQIFDDVKGIAPSRDAGADPAPSDEGPQASPEIELGPSVPDGEPAEDFRPIDEPPTSWPDEPTADDEP